MTNQENNEIIDVLLERPEIIEFCGRSFSISPMSLGKTLLMSKYSQMLGLSSELVSTNPQLALMLALKKNEDVACEMLAIYITSKHKNIVDSIYITELGKFIKESLGIEDKTLLLQMYFETKPIDYYFKVLGIDKEKEKLRKINNSKEKSSSVIVGGVSMFGSIIDAACERYKWTYEYVVWEISYTALQLIMADSVQSVYMTDKELAKAHISTDGINLAGNSQKSIDIMKSLIKQ